MPKKKANGYFIFMQEERKRIQAETRQAPSMQEMASLCNEAWKKLSPTERATYNARAKNTNGKGASDPDMYRMDNQRQIIAYRKSAALEAATKRTREKQLLVKSWEGKDILDIPFHIINFQVMYTEEALEYYLPVEVGMVSITLRDGINKHLHSFIDGGEVPHGNMHLALKHSENTHQIPLNFKEAESDFLGLWTKIGKFVVDDADKDEVPPIFCLAGETTMVESCLQHIHYQARCGEPNKFTKVYALEDLVISLLLQSRLPVKPSETQIHDSLLRNIWDYVSSIKCSYHDTVDCCHCSLAIVKRLSFAMFDMLSRVMDFKLGEGHMPDESSTQTFTVKPPSSFGSRPAARGARNTWQESTRSRSPSPSASMSPAHRYGSAEQRLWSAPNVSQLQVSLSSGEDDDEDDDIKSTSDQYELKELRKPTTNPMLPLVMGSGFGRGLTLPKDKENTPGESRNQFDQAASIRPPPGFGPRPGFPGSSMFRHQSMMRPAPGSYQPQGFSVSDHGRALEIALSRGRGRGLPPQVPPPSLPGGGR